MKNIGVQSLLFDERVLTALQRGQPAVFKLIDPDAGWVNRVQEAVTDATLVGRLHDLSHPAKLDAENGIRLAKACAAKAQETYIEIWEGSNEVVPASLDEFKRYVEFEHAFALELARQGLKPLIGGFATGTTPVDGDPDCQTKWRIFCDALADAWGMHWHEYWYAPQNGIIDDRWNAYRYEKWWHFLPEKLRREKWFLVSELGVEGHDPAVGARAGWVGKATVNDYWSHLQRYADALTNFSPRLAATLFYAGDIVDKSWQSYDVMPLIGNLEQAWKGDKKRVWGVGEAKFDEEPNTNMDVDKLNKTLSVRLGEAGIEYDNLIGHFHDKPGSTWLTKKRDMADLHGVALHHSVGPHNGSTKSIYDANVSRDLGGFAYHFVGYCYRKRDGSVWRKVRLMRNPRDYGAHVKGKNHEWLGFVWPGAYHEDAPDSGVLTAQAEALAIVVKVLREWTGNQDLVLDAHGQILPGYTACPDGGKWFSDKLLPAFDRAMAGTTKPPEADDYARGWNDALQTANQAFSQVVDDLRK